MDFDFTEEQHMLGETVRRFYETEAPTARLLEIYNDDTGLDRALIWYAAYAFDHRPEEAPRLAALAKAHLADRYVNASRTMVMLHGGIGYTWEFHCQFWVKRALFDRNYLGSPSVHRERAAVLAGW